MLCDADYAVNNPQAGPSKGSVLFRLTSAGVAVMGYYYYNSEFDNVLGLNFYTPYGVEAKWTTLVAGASIQPTRMGGAYSSVGTGYSSSNHSVDLGVKQHVSSFTCSDPVKGHRYGANNYPSYVMRFDAPPINYLGDDWGSILYVSVKINGQVYTDSMSVAPNWAGLN